MLLWKLPFNLGDAHIAGTIVQLNSSKDSICGFIGHVRPRTLAAEIRNRRQARGEMARRAQGAANKGNGGANLGFEAKLWAAADALRNNMDAAEYKHVVLGLIFLKYISDAFEAKHAELAAQKSRAPTRRTRTSTAPSTSSGCRRRRAGPISRRKRRSRPSASSSTTP